MLNCNCIYSCRMYAFLISEILRSTCCIQKLHQDGPMVNLSASKTVHSAVMNVTGLKLLYNVLQTRAVVVIFWLFWILSWCDCFVSERNSMCIKHHTITTKLRKNSCFNACWPIQPFCGNSSFIAVRTLKLLYKQM